MKVFCLFFSTGHKAKKGHVLEKPDTLPCPAWRARILAIGDQIWAAPLGQKAAAVLGGEGRRGQEMLAQPPAWLLGRDFVASSSPGYAQQPQKVCGLRSEVTESLGLRSQDAPSTDQDGFRDPRRTTIPSTAACTVAPWTSPLLEALSC